ncbi:MAG TPA: chloride channel protein [Conexibacter sp.]|nr:chloride channel protein [Conexibacter sp.]
MRATLHDHELPDDAVAIPDLRPLDSPERELGDFTATPALLRLVALAVAIGVAVAGVALVLLDLIGLIANLAYAGRWSIALTAPDPRRLGVASVLIPVAGGLVIGAMARFGSERIRGHGIPEAIETILLRGSRMEPRLAVLKPLSSAISIGSGGPFGAEGPIIVTGGAVGSIAGQLLHLTGAERRGLLVAGAAGGMTAVFGTPVAAVLLAVELLLFEWRPRSLLPVAFAAASAEAVREALARAGLVHPAPLFPVHALAHVPPAMLPGALLIGLASGALAWAMTRCVYAAEDAFARLPLHWAWWPALGGVVVGLGGLLDPRVLGAGYATIRAELAGKLALGALALLLVCKLAVWAIALGSNTSGGILAPLLMLGAALGGLLGAVVPGADQGTWALLGMAAAMAGVMRSPLTSIVFALELTHDVGALLPLLLACGLAHLASVLALRRSILTEKIARRGYHVNREYEVDPLQALFVRDVMRPVEDPSALRATLAAVPVVAYPDETLRHAADRMLATGRPALPVVAREDPRRPVGEIVQLDLLAAHERVLVEERRREAPLSPRRLRAVGALLPARGES